MSIDNILARVLEVEHGFQHILDGADEILSTYEKDNVLKLHSLCLNMKPIKLEC